VRLGFGRVMRACGVGAWGGVRFFISHGADVGALSRAVAPVALGVGWGWICGVGVAEAGACFLRSCWLIEAVLSCGAEGASAPLGRAERARGAVWGVVGGRGVVCRSCVRVHGGDCGLHVAVGDGGVCGAGALSVLGGRCVIAGALAQTARVARRGKWRAGGGPCGARRGGCDVGGACLFVLRADGGWSAMVGDGGPCRLGGRVYAPPRGADWWALPGSRRWLGGELAGSRSAPGLCGCWGRACGARAACLGFVAEVRDCWAGGGGGRLAWLVGAVGVRSLLERGVWAGAGGGRSWQWRWSVCGAPVRAPCGWVLAVPACGCVAGGWWSGGAGLGVAVRCAAVLDFLTWATVSSVGDSFASPGVGGVSAGGFRSLLGLRQVPWSVGVAACLSPHVRVLGGVAFWIGGRGFFGGGFFFGGFSCADVCPVGWGCVPAVGGVKVARSARCVGRDGPFGVQVACRWLGGSWAVPEVGVVRPGQDWGGLGLAAGDAVGRGFAGWRSSCIPWHAWFVLAAARWGGGGWRGRRVRWLGGLMGGWLGIASPGWGVGRRCLGVFSVVVWGRQAAGVRQSWRRGLQVGCGEPPVGGVP